MEKNLRTNSMLTTIKLYLFPTLVTILAMMIWRDVTELRSDVKSLLAQSSIDKTKIENLEKDVKMLQQMTFKKLAANNIEVIRSLPHDRFFKHEEIFDVKKYINNEPNQL